MARYLFIVAHDQPDLWAHLAREFSGEAGVQVLLDRRRLERRRPPGPSRAHPRDAAASAHERRQSNRRSRPIHHQLASMNFALVPTE